MPRRQRCRLIGGYPDNWGFSPQEASSAAPVVLSLDEFETVRLLDREGMTQEQCASLMGVSRTTVTSIYDSARKKLAEALVEGKGILIGGGSCALSRPMPENITQKEKDTMRIAVTYEDGQIFQHFGHTSQFKLYDAENGVITAQQVLQSGASGHGALAGLLKSAQVDALICGGIGGGARMALEEAGISLYAGVSGAADDAARALAEGKLEYSPDATCHEHDHGEGHDCYSHSHGCHTHGEGHGHGCHGHDGEHGHGQGKCPHRRDAQ